MCDYSLHHVSSRPARVSDKLVTMKLAKSSIRAFAAVGEYGAKLVIHDGAPEVAVCLLPGTELAFDDDVRYDRAFSLLGKARVHHKVARFRQIDLDDPHVQHDALEFPDGQVLKVAQLAPGQTATVLQLPVATQHHEHAEHRHAAHASEGRVALNMVPSSPGMASMLMPNQSAVLLWQSCRSAAVELSMALAQSFRRLQARKQPPADVEAETIEASFNPDVLVATLPEKSAAPKPEKKVEVRTAA